MAVVKIKRSKNGDPSVDTGKTSPAKKKIKIKTKLNGETNKVSTPRPRIKINLKKDNKEKSAEKTGPMKVKLSLKKKDEHGIKVKRHEPRVRVKAIRVPGEGYDSEDSDVETDPLIESGIILRVVPDTQVDFVKNSIEAGDYSGISVKWLSERHAVVTINGYMYGAILVDLPTIIEVNKSVDRKNLLKTFDVCQMLLCIKTVSNEEEVFGLQIPDSSDVISNHYEDIIDEINKEKTTLMRHHVSNGNNHLNATKLNKIATKGYDFNHGLTAPLYNVRNRRFRRKMNPVEFDYVESVVESLLNDDDKAEESVFELITEEEISTKPLPLTTHSQINLTPQQQQQIISAGSKETSLSLSASSTPHFEAAVSSTPGLPRESAELQTGAEDEDEDEDLDLEAAFESEEDEAGEDKAVINGKIGAETKSGTEDLFDESGAEEEESEEGESDEDEDEDEDEENDGSRGDKNAKRQHIELLADELKELESTLSHTRRKVDKATNPLLKSRFIDSIKKLEKEVELKKKQLGSIQLEDKSEAASVQGDQQQSQQQQQLTQVVDEDDEEDEDLDDEEEESAEDDDDENAQDHPESPENPENTLDQNDLDMMMLFGAEAEEEDED